MIQCSRELLLWDALRKLIYRIVHTKSRSIVNRKLTIIIYSTFANANIFNTNDEGYSQIFLRIRRDPFLFFNHTLRYTFETHVLTSGSAHTHIYISVYRTIFSHFTVVIVNVERNWKGEEDDKSSRLNVARRRFARAVCTLANEYAT